MFDYLSQYDVILVTGPQRSGTTICARMISHDLGHKYVDEAAWGVWDGMKAVQLAKKYKPCVLQAPGLLKDVERFGNAPNVAVVLMRRSIRDIQASQERIGWNVWAEREMSNYLDAVSKTERATYLKRAAYYVSHMKYAWFERYGRSKVKHLYEVEYADLQLHSMWIDKARRENFNARQYKT